MAQVQVKNIRPVHEHIMEVMVENPGMSLRELGAATGYSVSYLSIMTNSDAFRARFAEVRKEVTARSGVDLPVRMRAVAAVALDKLADHVERSEDPDFLRGTADMMLHRLGYAPQRVGGIAASGDVNVQQNFFVPREMLAELRGRIIDGSPSVARREDPALREPHRCTVVATTSVASGVDPALRLPAGPTE